MIFRCPHCLISKRPLVAFEFDSVTGECPRCGKFSSLELVPVHYIILGSGPLFGQHGGKQHIACQPKRDYLARHEQDMFSATAEARQVTCLECQRTRAWQQAAKFAVEHDPEFAGKMAVRGVKL